MNAKDFEFEVELIALANSAQNIANRGNEFGDVLVLNAGMELKKETEARKFEVVNTNLYCCCFIPAVNFLAKNFFSAPTDNQPYKWLVNFESCP